jgi:xanthine dehydrogenase molybdopterin-binding subunit B
MRKSIIDMSTEEIHTDSRHPTTVLYSASFILSDDDIPEPYGQIVKRMEKALRAHNRIYQWLMIPENKVVYSKFPKTTDLP